MSKMWMNGYTCFECGNGWYNGYDLSGKKKLTAPCNKCGHQLPAVLNSKDFHKMIEKRDKIHEIYFVDLDDTLTKSKANVEIVKDGKVLKEIHNYTTYKLQPGESFSFRQHKIAKLFHETSIPIEKAIKRFNKLVGHKHAKTVILTGRSDFDDHSLFLKTLKKHNIYSIELDIVLVGSAADGGSIIDIAGAKAKRIRTYLDTMRYKKAVMIDDNVMNLNRFLEVSESYPNIEFVAWKAYDSGHIRRLNRP